MFQSNGNGYFPDKHAKHFTGKASRDSRRERGKHFESITRSCQIKSYGKLFPSERKKKKE